ncbi:MAG: pyridoxamine 5'-phosphate oxidase family protein [Actinocrinis sp.]
MTLTRSWGFHTGELAVQRRAGVSEEAERLTGMLAPASLRGGGSRFLAERTFAALTARDREGRLWISPLAGRPGFLDGQDTALYVRAVFEPSDPLRGLASGQLVGLAAVDFASRRRVRVNGTLASAGDNGLVIAVDEAFGNCPKYIQQRRLDLDRGAPGAEGDRDARASRMTTDLNDRQIDLITHADTFLLGTTHPERGNDASHRGGTPGFVRVEGDTLWWPDYPGNNMFNSLGNIAVDDSAALLFVDFATGATLHLSGVARLDWIETGSAGDDGGTGRQVRFTVQRVADGARLPLHMTDATAAVTPSPYNWPLRDARTKM